MCHHPPPLNRFGTSSHIYVWICYLSNEAEDVTVDVEVDVEVDIDADFINLETSCNFGGSLAYTQEKPLVLSGYIKPHLRYSAEDDLQNQE